MGAVPQSPWQGCMHLELESEAESREPLFWTGSSPPDSITPNLFGLGLFNTVVQIGL